MALAESGAGAPPLTCDSNAQCCKVRKTLSRTTLSRGQSLKARTRLHGAHHSGAARTIVRGLVGARRITRTTRAS
jgi:hypothetical protein